jgi:hypothetical protein
MWRECGTWEHFYTTAAHNSTVSYIQQVKDLRRLKSKNHVRVGKLKTLFSSADQIVGNSQ